MNHNCPDPNTRDRAADLATLSRAVFKDLLTGSERLTPHVMEGGDLLVLYVEGALGANVRIQWAKVTDEELPTIRAWADYCGSLFDSVETHVMERLS